MPVENRVTNGSQQYQGNRGKVSKHRAQRFRRTRRDHATETAEDYVEAIAEIITRRGECRGTNLAQLFDVSHVTVSKTVARLKAEGLVRAEPYGPLELTARGQRLAQASRQRHDLVLRFLRAIGVSDETARVDAEGIEHHVSRETLDRFRGFIDGRE
jgi:DtxR family manganese transport transcriptional regulator